MADWDLSDLAQELSDLEVALLICLVAHGHPLIETTEDGIDDVAKELALVLDLVPQCMAHILLTAEKQICANTFDLPCAVLDCSSMTSVEDFYSKIAASDSRKGQIQPPRSRAGSVCTVQGKPT